MCEINILDSDYDNEFYGGSYKAEPALWNDTADKVVLAMHKIREGRAEVGVEGSWGGKEGPQVNIYADLKAKDKRGNDVNLNITRKNDGTGTYRGSVGHDMKEKNTRNNEVD